MHRRRLEHVPRHHREIEVEKSPLYEEIGRLKMELEWLKKKASLFDK